MHLPSIKILVVDDQPHMRKVLRTMLAGLSIDRVSEAANGAEGLRAIVECKPDVVLVDWDMPVMNGLEFVKRVRTPGQFPHPDVPMIMLTGHGERWRVLEAARFGIHEFLLKPISTQALLDRIKIVLSQRREMMAIEKHYIPSPRRLVVLDADVS